MATDKLEQPLIISLDQLRPADLVITGEKGAALGRLIQEGLEVPSGFAVTTNAFKLFLTDNNLRKSIVDEINDLNTEKFEEIDAVSRKIRKLIQVSEIPREVQDAILAEHKKLRAEFVAVRGSGHTIKDNPASWAGELETYLNTTSSDLLNNIRKSWSSIFTARAIYYGLAHDLSEAFHQMAVVVQEMVDADVSGQAYTAHPATRDQDMVLIEAVFGLGEALVAEITEPDTYIVDKSDRTIFDTNIGTQDKKIVRVGKKTSTVDVPEEEGKKRALSEAEILKLTDLTLKIEKLSKEPQIVEWALRKGKFYILQNKDLKKK